MRTKPCESKDGIAVLAGARAAAQADAPVPADAMARFNELVGRGALEAMAPMAAWTEIERAMAAPAPWRFVEVLRDCGALAHMLPELDTLFGVPQLASKHPEICAGVHSLLTLRRAAERTDDAAIRFAALLHDIGKAATPRDAWPLHHDHDRLGARAVERLAARLQMPVRFRELAYLAARHHGAVQRLPSLPAGEVRALLAAVGTPERRHALAIVCEADHRGRFGHERAPCPQVEALRAA
jgi:tRNA nucleotidyltransferase (CCA-adding enzyme)